MRLTPVNARCRYHPIAPVKRNARRLGTGTIMLTLKAKWHDNAHFGLSRKNDLPRRAT